MDDISLAASLPRKVKACTHTRRRGSCIYLVYIHNGKPTMKKKNMLATQVGTNRHYTITARVTLVIVLLLLLYKAHGMAYGGGGTKCRKTRQHVS